MIGGRAARIPPAIIPVVFMAYLPMNSAMATGAVLEANVLVKIKA
jgi:hypothetical protein